MKTTVPRFQPGERVRIIAACNRQDYVGMTGTVVERSARGQFQNGQGGFVCIAPDQDHPGLPNNRVPFGWDDRRVAPL